MSAVSALYARLATIRRSRYTSRPDRQRRLVRPVVSVGNLVVGGSGKTPLVVSLARMLLEQGERPAILSRGYRRRSRQDGVLVVSDGASVLANVEASGDEPQMLARALAGVPVLVARERYLAGVIAERRLGCTVHLLDDGFQHLELARDVDLLLVHPDDLREKVLPAGRLREPLNAARAAHALLVPGSQDDALRVAGAVGVATTFAVAARFEGLELLGSGVSSFDAPRPPYNFGVLGVAGIARPERFFEALRREGYDVAATMAFRDHHWFTERDVARIGRRAREVGAEAIVTTEKDAARLVPLVRASEQPCPWAVLPMRLEVAPAFQPWLAEQLREARG